eukprot:CAMPEP_0170179228 /NCGR_PEP_ID=MMETSP0040_2-20121228/16823_1 /TAXON_ID=641309 /ORGANISM="Lotharella oceanica, Strain CCMP622" /LENGTH=188 /DNA_ID=CAMNT_0010423153 /DNA_START=75 /DNA_END=641 /DNA_ORIENTATION=+
MLKRIQSHVKENGIAAILKETKDSISPKSARKHRLSDTNSVKSTKSEPIAKRKEARRKKRQSSSMVMQQRIAGLRKLYGMRTQHENDDSERTSGTTTRTGRFPNHNSSSSLALPPLQSSSSRPPSKGGISLPRIRTSEEVASKTMKEPEDGEGKKEDTESGDLSDWEKEVDDLVDWSKGLELEDSAIT